MIDTKLFVNSMNDAEIKFVTGVPDSLLKDLCAEITTSFPNHMHIIASNEGSSVALAIGHYLSTGEPALVYMQNSGIGNSINPLTSLADPLVYSIPMIILIGWRGEIQDNGQQVKDEPQHKKQGELTLKQLDLLGIPFTIIDKNCKNISEIISKAKDDSLFRSGPVAIVVRKGSFSPFIPQNKCDLKYEMSREDVIEKIVEYMPEDWPFVCTTGVASRELFEIRKRNDHEHSRDFLTVGGMGHASSIAAGIAQNLKKEKVVCIDGDGAALMHLGALAINADFPNLIHIIINNEVHDSVGGQPTKGSLINFSKVGLLLGYKHCVRVKTSEDFKSEILSSRDKVGSILIEVICNPGFRSNLSRPDRTPIENKNDFMFFLGEKNEK